MRVFVAAVGLLAATAITIGAAAAQHVGAGAPLPRLLDRAAAGDAPSLRMVASLRRASDAARAEAIDRALSDALVTNPTVVLRLIGGRGLPGAGWYCQDRDIEPAPAAYAHFVHAATAAVRAVRDDRLSSVRAQCLATLEGSGSAPARS